MLNNDRHLLPDNFPDEFYNKAHSLESIGSYEMSWNYMDILDVIEYYTNNGYAILGGDVYAKQNDEIILTYDNWYINKDPNLKWNQYVEISKKKAIEYINNYHKTNGDNFYYVVVVDNK